MRGRTEQVRKEGIKLKEAVIELTQGKVSIVGVEDFEQLSKHKWYFHKNGYAVRNRKKSDGPGSRCIRMHREILRAPDDLLVDHINGDKLDNRRSNIRLATKSQNECNKGPSSLNGSGYRGVSWSKQKRKWHVRVYLDAKCQHVGFFSNIEEAALAYNEATKKIHGSFSRENELVTRNKE
jgi:hypothetical protein